MNTIPVFYSDNIVADTTSYSPSSSKPREVVADWRAHDLPISVITPSPVDRMDLYAAHRVEHVNFILDCEKPNGFGNLDTDVARSLPYTSGAMLDAARYALGNGQVACAPVSGFHHAGWDFTGGFCTFNGLMVTLYKLRKLGLIKRAAILDLDMHWGNGTDDIIDTLGSRGWVEHFSVAPSMSNAELFLEDLPLVIKKWTDFGNKPDIILYQAGADSHIDDPLGGYLTTEQMRRRDRIVFETCKKLEIPVAWNLAGGYQRDKKGSIEPVLALHRGTMQECAAVFTEQARYTPG